MELTNRFEVEAPASTTWDLLMDVPRVVPCMPGAQLVEAVSEDRWKIEMKTKLGPMSMAFDADVLRGAVDAEGRVVTLEVRARERRGRGQAKATIASGLEAMGAERTQVDVRTELSLSGRIGQFGRGAVQDVAAEMTDRFTANLQKALAEDGGAQVPEVMDPHAAIGAWSVLLGALRRRLARLFTATKSRA